MPNINTMRESKFLKRSDCGRGILVTIAGCEQQNVAMENDAPDMKWVLLFSEKGVKPMVLNSTNQQLIAKALGSDETDDWMGRKIVLYDDPNVSFGGKLVGGIRARAPKPGTTTQGAGAPAAGAKPAATSATSATSAAPAEAPGEEDPY